MFWTGLLCLGFACVGAMAQTPAPAAKDPSRSPAALEMAQGEQLLAQARFEEAAGMFQLAAGKEPQNPAAWNMLGLALHAQKDWRKAIPAFEKAHALMPSEALILDNLGVCHFELHEHERAAALFRSAVERNPADSRAHLFLARIAVIGGEHERAEREFDLAVSAPAPDPVASLHQGLYFLQERRLDDARKAFERALSIDPDQAGAHFNLGLVLQRQGHAEQAATHLRRFRELTEITVGEEHMRLRVTAHVRNAHLELEAGRTEAALWSALRACEEAPELPIVHQLLGRIHAQAGRIEESQRELAIARDLVEKARSR